MLVAALMLDMTLPRQTLAWTFLCAFMLSMVAPAGKHKLYESNGESAERCTRFYS